MPGVDLNYFIRQANKLTEKIEKRKQELAEEIIEKKSQNDLVTVKVNGAQEIKGISIAKAAVDPNDVGMLEDLLIATVNSALADSRVRMQSELALRQTDRGEIHRSLEQLAKSSEAATRLVNQLLALARAENQPQTGSAMQPLDLGELARIWKGGCIIRAQFLGRIKAAYDRDANLPNLLLDSDFVKELGDRQQGWRNTIAQAIQAGIPTMAMSGSLNYYDSIRAAKLPANLTQAQRDYFGAHTYERFDKPGNFHTEWLAK